MNKLALACVGIIGLFSSQSAVRADEFPVPHNTEKSATPPMSPEEVCRSAKVPPGFHLTLFASEPDVQNPIAITTDERGRVWVAENYTWAGSLAGNFDMELRDRVVVLEDADGDGACDQRTVFWDKAKRLTSIERGFGGMWLLCSPQLLFIPDRNRDDVPDGPPVVMLDGFEPDDGSHTLANGLKWGPDGWLYGRQGILGTSAIGVPGSTDAERITMNTGVWRFHPTRRVCEAVMHGMTNPWGFDYDAYGEIFVSNTVIGHLWHVIPGARTERMFGMDYNPHAYQLIEQAADHVHWHTGESWDDVRGGVTDRTSAAGGGHAHTGLLIYQGDNWPAEYGGRAFTMNLHGRRINCDLLSRTSVGYTARHGQDMCFISDPYFRPTDLINSSDGVLIADWSDTGECHETDGVHRTTGRIYKLSYGQRKARERVDLVQLSDADLSAVQTHANDWYTRQARRLLQERAHDRSLHGDIAETHLLKIFHESSNKVYRLRALWALHLIEALDRAWLLEQLSDHDEHIRVWALRLLVDSLKSDQQAANELITAITLAASADDSGLVLLHLASTLQRLPLKHRYNLGRAILAKRKPEFNSDKTLAIMLWLGMEPLVASDSAGALALLRETSFPLVQENIARRLASQIDDARQPVEALLAIASEDKSRSSTILTGMAKALEGRRSSPVPQNWSKASSLLNAANIASDQRLLELGALFRDREILQRLQRVAGDTNAPPEERRRALRLVIGADSAELAPLLQRLITDPLLSVDALKGLAVVESGETPTAILDVYDDLASEAKDAAIATLSSRISFSRILLQAVKEGRLPPTEISAFHARQIVSLRDPEVTTQLQDVWGDIRANSAEKRKVVDQLKTMLSEEELQRADIAIGRAVFARACASCHMLFGEGGKVGPDLTGSDRKNPTYLLKNIVDPSAVVGADYRASVILLAEGRVVTGVVREQTERTVAIETPEGRQVFDRQDIEEISKSDVSVMPDGLLHGLSNSEIINLMAFLMSD